MKLLRLNTAWLPWLCLACAMGSILTLHRINRSLYLRLESVNRVFNEYRQRAETLTPGVLLPALSGKTNSGNPLTIGFNQPQRTLVLVFTQSCPYCRRNWENWSRLIKQTSPAVTRVVAVDLRGPTEEAYIKSHGLERIPLITSVDYASTAAYKFRNVPTTMLIEPNGTLSHVWTGVLDAAAMTQLESAVQTAGGEPQSSSMKSTNDPDVRTLTRRKT